MWEKLSDDGSIHDQDDLYALGDAFAMKLAMLNSTSFAGHDDWRMPNAKELHTIVDYDTVGQGSPPFVSGCAPGCTVLTCSCTALTFYWTSTTSISVPDGAWVVALAGGDVFAGSKGDAFGVRAVRGGS